MAGHRGGKAGLRESVRDISVPKWDTVETRNAQKTSPCWRPHGLDAAYRRVFCRAKASLHACHGRMNELAVLILCVFAVVRFVDSEHRHSPAAIQLVVLCWCTPQWPTSCCGVQRCIHRDYVWARQ